MQNEGECKKPRIAKIARGEGSEKGLHHTTNACEVERRTTLDTIHTKSTTPRQSFGARRPRIKNHYKGVIRVKWQRKREN